MRPPDPPGAPFERSAGLDDPTGGGPFSLTSSGQTWCPRCYQSNMLEPVETPEVRPTVRTRVVEDTNAMDGVGGDAAEVSTLISKWDLVSVSKLEAGKKKDYVFKLGKDKRKRIDREEPVTDGHKNVAHAKYRLQFGKKTYAGVWLVVDTVLDAAVIRRAFQESVNSGKYVEVYVGVS